MGQKEVRKMKRAVDKAKRMKEEAPQMNQLLIQSRREDPWMTDLFMRDLGDKRGDLLKIKLVAVLSNSSQLKPIMPQMTKMAETSDGEVACAYFVASDYPQLRNLLNIGGNDERDLPALVAINIPDGDKFVVPFEKVKLRKEPEIMSFDAIDRFISDVRSDLIKPTIKSEEPPKDRKANRAKAIVTITGRTFLDDVVDAPQEIILKLYAPWCGNCKSFAPVFNRTSRLFAKEDRISFAEMDLSQNELPKHLQSMVSSYPTLLYFHGDNPKNVTSLEGPLTMEAVAEHVLSNTRLNKTTYPEYQGSGCKFDAPLYQKMTVPLGAFDQVVSDTRGSVNWYLDAVVSVWNENAVLLELPVGRTGVLKDAVVSAGLKVDANGIAGLTSQSLVVVCKVQQPVVMDWCWHQLVVLPQTVLRVMRIGL